MLKDMEKSEPWLADLDKDLYDTLKEVYEELVKIDANLEDITALDTLTDNVIDTFLIEHNLSITAELKKQLITPYAIAKYIILTIQQSELITKINKELEQLLDKEKVSWLVYDDFTNKVVFTKILPVNSEEKPQSLAVKYRIDPETDTIIYSIMAGHWGWDIDKLNLKALLEGSKISSTESINTPIKNTKEVDNKGISISVEGVEIIIKKKV